MIDFVVDRGIGIDVAAKGVSQDLAKASLEIGNHVVGLTRLINAEFGAQIAHFDLYVADLRSEQPGPEYLPVCVFFAAPTLGFELPKNFHWLSSRA